ncbi:hypothetical protein PInf_006278 [Phytophthora infestans]|nr:hypothetical protein PInf_006278 [Phytophthora infestans]
MARSRLRAALIVGLSAVCAASSSTFDSPLQFRDASPLFTLQQTVNPSLDWAKYEHFLLSRSRSTPLLLYFTPASTCYDENNDQGDEDQEVESPAIDQEACLHHQKLVDRSVELAAEKLSTPQLPFVRVDAQRWPKMLDYHLMTITPSLLWIPGRASSRFQRYPHVETNFLDLSANKSIFAGEKSKDTSDEVAKVATQISAFVSLCRERSGYLTRNARGGLSPTVPVHPDDDTFSGLELIPVLAFLAFVGLVVNENRSFVLGVVRTRFFWFVLCLGVIYVALSGFFHSIIHRRGWYYFSRMHGFVFVYPSSRRQFILEGLVNGTWSFWLSLGVMSVADVAPSLKSRLAREEVIRNSLLLVVLSYMALHFTFLLKYRWLA